ncbi:prepilin peptidase [Candidatus Gottesmanbacteria bacterium]|nr:prepilin peptidase [Candidatus Gottesmanbacteria bacterium]
MLLSFWVYLMIFTIGVCIGSFFNVVIDRWPKGKSIVKKRSHCEFCKRQLAPLDLIPIVSFLFLRGKCRYCHKKLSWQYPLVELATGFSLVLTFFLLRHISFWPFFSKTDSIFYLLFTIYYLLTTCYFILIFIIDLKYEIIIDDIINSAIIITIIYYFLIAFSFIIPALISGVIVALFFRFLIFISRGRGLGEGDVKLGFWLGLLLGFPKIIPGLFMAFVLGAIIGLGLVFSGKKKFGQTVPLAPFLIIGTYISLFFGQQIIALYLKTFL